MIHLLNIQPVIEYRPPVRRVRVPPSLRFPITLHSFSCQTTEGSPTVLSECQMRSLCCRFVTRETEITLLESTHNTIVLQLKFFSHLMTLTRIKITTIQLWALLVGTKSPLFMLLNTFYSRRVKGNNSQRSFLGRREEKDLVLTHEIFWSCSQPIIMNHSELSLALLGE